MTRRLVVFSERFADTVNWCRTFGIQPRLVMHANIHDNPNKIRGLSENRTGFVFLAPAHHGPELLGLILSTYSALGVPTFDELDETAIKAWLAGGSAPASEMSWCIARHARKCERVVEWLVHQLRIVVALAAAEQRRYEDACDALAYALRAQRELCPTVQTETLGEQNPPADLDDGHEGDGTDKPHRDA